MTPAPIPSPVPPVRPVDTAARARLAALAATLPATVAGANAGDARGLLATDRVIPVHPALDAVLPQGIVQGSTVACTGSAATSAALLVVAEATRQGAWVGVAGLPGLGAQAAGEMGVALERLVAVRGLGGRLRPDGAAALDAAWGPVLAALVDGFDLVVLGPDVRVRAGTARRVQARAHRRGAVLVLAGDVDGFVADAQVRARARWEGLGDGHGHLRARRVAVQVHGRRVPRPRHVELWAPGADGRVDRVDRVDRVPSATAALPDGAPHLERTG
jgi:hypothetical protein